MFGKLKKMFGNEEESELVVVSPITGKTIPVTQVNDPTFSEKMLGNGIAIIPSGNRVVAPVSGTIGLMFDTGHAVTIESDKGIEILIHIGLDTISLNGKHYTMHAQTGDKVSVGDLLIEFDKDAIAADGFDTVTPVVISNTDEFEDFIMVENQEVTELDPIIHLKKKK